MGCELPAICDLVDYVNLDTPSSFSSGADIFGVPLQSSTCIAECPSLSVPDSGIELPSQQMATEQSISGGVAITIGHHGEAAEEQTPAKQPPMPKDKNKGISGNLPFPNRFSIRVEKAIEDGNVLPVRRQLIADVGIFYSGICSHPQQGDYKRMAIMICDKFPELKDSNNARYWVSVCR